MLAVSFFFTGCSKKENINYNPDNFKLNIDPKDLCPLLNLVDKTFCNSSNYLRKNVNTNNDVNVEKLNIDPKDLLGIMNSESGLNPQAVNKSSGATGLIQFMPATAKSLGTTVSPMLLLF